MELTIKQLIDRKREILNKLNIVERYELQEINHQLEEIGYSTYPYVRVTQHTQKGRGLK